PHVRAVGRGDGFAAWADLSDEARPRRRDGDEPDLRRPLRQVPGLHGVPDGLPVGRAVRQADRGDPGAGRAALPALGLGPITPVDDLRAVPPPPPAAGRSAAPMALPAQRPAPAPATHGRAPAAARAAPRDGGA